MVNKKDLVVGILCFVLSFSVMIGYNYVYDSPKHQEKVSCYDGHNSKVIGLDCYHEVYNSEEMTALIYVSPLAAIVCAASFFLGLMFIVYSLLDNENKRKKK